MGRPMGVRMSDIVEVRNSERKEYGASVWNQMEKPVTGLLAVGIVVFLLMIVVTNVFHFTYRLDADISSEVVLGKEIWLNKQIVPETWYISTEARIIGPLNFAALFYGMTHNMVLSMGLACCVMTLLIVCSMFYFGKSLGWKLWENLLFILMGLAVPVLFDFLEMLYLFACYYAIHVVNLFLTMGVYAEALREKKIRRGMLVLCTLLAFGLGMQGVRGMLVFYGPLFGMEVIRNLYRIYCKEKADKTDRLVSLWVVCLLLLNFLGTLFPVSIDQELSRNIRKGFQKLFTEVVPNMITAVGLEAANPLEKAALVFLLCVIILLGVDIALRMFRKETIGAAEWSFLIICASPVITALMMAFTTFETTERYYFMLTYAFAMAAVLAFIRLRTLRKRHLSKTVELLLAAAVAVIVVSNLFSIYIPIVKTEEPPQSREYEIAQYLEENGFQTGYSTFHHANNLTVLSNGRVRVAAVASLDRMNVCRWLSSSDWYVPNVPYEERTAYIVPEAEMENFAEFLKLHEKDLRFETQIGNYSIYSSAYNFSNMEY